MGLCPLSSAPCPHQYHCLSDFLLLGVYLIYLLRLLFLLPIFWIQSSRGLEEIFFDLSKIQSRPHEIYQGRIRYLVLFVLPFAITVSFPVQILFFGMNWHLIAHFGFILLFFSALVQWFWNKAIKAILLLPLNLLHLIGDRFNT